MSILSDRKHVICDGEECDQAALLPVALRSVLSRGRDEENASTVGWLFIRHNESWQHFCPQCSKNRLSDLSHHANLLTDSSR